MEGPILGFLSWFRQVFIGDPQNTLENTKTKLDERKQPNEPRTKATKKAVEAVAEPAPKKRVVSAETRAKLSAASKAAHARKKAAEAAKQVPAKKVAVKSTGRAKKVTVKTAKKTK